MDSIPDASLGCFLNFDVTMLLLLTVTLTHFSRGRRYVRLLGLYLGGGFLRQAAYIQL